MKKQQWKELAGKTTIFPGDASLRVRVWQQIWTSSTLLSFMAVYARCVTGNILQNNSKEHWEVKIIHIAAEHK